MPCPPSKMAAKRHMADRHRPHLTQKGITMKFINVGYGNLVVSERIVLIASPESAPLKRLIQDAKDQGRAVDLTCGKKTRAVILTDTEIIILSALTPDKLSLRAAGEQDDNDTDA